MNEFWDECSVKEKMTWVLVISFAIGLSIGYISGAIFAGVTSRAIIKDCQESYMKQLNETNKCCFAHGMNITAFMQNKTLINGS